MSRESTLAGDLLREFRTRFGDSDGLQVALAPGRVNLIGEHTDYNDGWALPMAIDRHIGIAFRPSGNRRIRVHSLEFNETREIDLDALTPLSDQPWPAYVAGVAWAMGEAGHELSGMEGVIGGNLPIGAGVSSSAALEMAVARALCEASKIPWVPEEMARLGRKADNDYIGIGSGPLDQLASAASQEGCALLLDCRTLETRAIHLPSNVRVVAMDTGVRRALAESEYNDRLASCQRAVEALRHIDSSINALRDADIGLLVAARDQLDDTSFQRARHVIEENERPVAMASALSAGRLAEAGSLMNDSHTSLRKLYEVSSPELDLITDLARDHAACFGARLTGAGFGGCAIALVASDGVTDFVSKVHRAYSEQIDLPSAFFDCRPAAGAKLRDAGDGRTVTTTENDRERPRVVRHGSDRHRLQRIPMTSTLVILAAGAGSRYGGLKQLAPIGPHGETLLEYAVFDALRAGFERIVLVVRPDKEVEFRERFKGSMDRGARIEYAHQTINDLPNGSRAPAGRSKPWGTGQAVLAAAEKIKEPFAVVNADDFYGAESYQVLADFLGQPRPRESALAVVGFPVARTLTDAGPVSRALCEVDREGRLKKIVELDSVWRQGGRVVYKDDDGNDHDLEADELVSMNMWGLTPDLFSELEDRFRGFLAQHRLKPEAEFLLPEVIQDVVQAGRLGVEVLQGKGEWCGMTFREDRERVAGVLSTLIEQGRYPEELWK